MINKESGKFPFKNPTSLLDRDCPLAPDPPQRFRRILKTPNYVALILATLTLILGSEPSGMVSAQTSYTYWGVPTTQLLNPL